MGFENVDDDVISDDDPTQSEVCRFVGALPGNNNSSRKVTSVLDAISKKNQDDSGSDEEEKQLSEEIVNQEEVDQTKDEVKEMYPELEDQMCRLSVNDFERDLFILPQTTSRRIISVLKSVKSDDEVEGEKEEDEEENGGNSDVVLNERGPMVNGRTSRKIRPYDSSPTSTHSSDSSNSPQSSPTYQPEINNFSPPQTIKYISQISGNGGTCSVFQAQLGVVAIEPKVSSKSLHLNVGGIVQNDYQSLNTPNADFLDRNGLFHVNTWSPSSPIDFEPAYFLDPSSCMRRDVDELSPFSIPDCSSPSSEESLSPGAVLSPATLNESIEPLSHLNIAVDEINPSITQVILNVDGVTYDIDYSDKFFDIPGFDDLDNDVSVQHFSESMFIPPGNSQRRRSTSPRYRNLSRSRSNSGRSVVDVEKRTMEILNSYPTIKPRPLSASFGENQTIISPIVEVKKSARDMLDARLNPETKAASIVKVDTESFESYQIGDNEGDTNLHIMVARYCAEDVFAVVEKFHERKVSIDIPNLNGQTPLFSAVMRNDPLIVEYLIERGANPGHMCKDGVTPLHLVAKYGDQYLDVARVLCKTCTPHQLNQKTRDDYTPVHYAVKHSDSVKSKCIAVIETLLKSGAQINAEAQCGRDGKSALHVAVEKGSLELVTAICGACHNISEAINHPTFNGDTALHLALRLNSACDEHIQMAIIKVLIDNGAKNVQNKENKCPTYYVAEKKLKEFVKRLFSQKK